MAIKQRRPKNAAEGAFFDEAQRRGWTLTKRGWPDFLAWKDGEMIAVEVKPHCDHPLKREQLAVMAALSMRGVKCFRWTPDGGLEEFDYVAEEDRQRRRVPQNSRIKTAMTSAIVQRKVTSDVSKNASR